LTVTKYTGEVLDADGIRDGVRGADFVSAEVSKPLLAGA
jgi:hypothetical protein